MEPANAFTPGPCEDSRQAQSSYRSLALTAAVVIPGFGVVRHLIDPATGDPMLERIAIAVLLVVYSALTLVEGPVRRHPYRAIAVVLYLVSGAVIHLAYVNGVTVNTGYGLLIMLFACSMAFRTWIELGVYLLTGICAISLIVVTAPVVEIDPLFFMATVAAVGALTFVVQFNRISVVSALRDARDTARAAVDARSRFLANISHEIRTPMNGVIGMATLMEATDLTPTQRDYLRTIRTSGNALLALLNDILDFSKIESGHVQLERRPFDPVECVEGAMALVTPTAREKGLELVFDCDPNLPAELVGDSLRLRQILVNLLSNSVKFTSEGEIHVRVGGAQDGAGGYRLDAEVRDTGIGIPADRVDSLFQAFVQADSSTTRRFGGTGLGLSICRQLLEHMGGSIDVETREHAGSTFRFHVPLELGGGTPRQPWRLESGGARVLVVEPHDTMRSAVCRVLESWGLEHDAVADPAAAANALQCSDYAVVVAGTGAPEMDALRQGCRPGSTPAFIRIAPMPEAPADHGHEIPILYRPLRHRALRRALEQALAVRRRIEAGVPAVARPDADAAPGTRLAILVAEDNLVNQRVTVKMLERLGYRAEVVSNGRDAVAVAAARRFDLVLMDLQMPVMDGLEATRRLRAELQGARSRIVAMTANAQPGDREACLDAGMDDFLCKPVKMVELEALLARFDLPEGRASWARHA